jgi:hypothetical protein
MDFNVRPHHFCKTPTVELVAMSPCLRVEWRQGDLYRVRSAITVHAERANRLGPGSAPKQTSGICVFATHDLDTAGIGHEQAGKQLEERCLAGTIRNELSGECVETHAVYLPNRT